jgi:hypothetical protein
MKPKKNPVTKIIGAGVKAAMRGKKTSKGLITTANKDIQKLTTGRAKANVRNVKVENFGVNITKGKNKDWAKEANKSISPAAATSRRATLKEVNLNNRLSKHPLVRNAGNASSETKYRVMRGKPVPVKKKSK